MALVVALAGIFILHLQFEYGFKMEELEGKIGCVIVTGETKMPKWIIVVERKKVIGQLSNYPKCLFYCLLCIYVAKK